MKITSFGEVLWDDLPSGKVLGGAPLNVLVRLSALGADCRVISRRGADVDGEELVRQVKSHGVNAGSIQVDAEQPTSLVKVKLDKLGSASYEILYPCAWDKIAADAADKQRVAESDAFVYGSLSTRDAVSRATLDELLAAAKFKVFDVNMRKPFYDAARLLGMMKQADLVKLNDDELFELVAAYGSPYHGLAQNIRFLADLSGVRRLCVTLGRHGVVYFCEGKLYSHHGYRVKVADTVGAGDSFLAGFIFQLLQGKEPEEILDFACALGALAASKHGATPEISLQDISVFRQPEKG